MSIFGGSHQSTMPYRPSDNLYILNRGLKLFLYGQKPITQNSARKMHIKTIAPSKRLFLRIKFTIAGQFTGMLKNHERRMDKKLTTVLNPDE